MLKLCNRPVEPLTCVKQRKTQQELNVVDVKLYEKKTVDRLWRPSQNSTLESLTDNNCPSESLMSFAKNKRKMPYTSCVSVTPSSQSFLPPIHTQSKYKPILHRSQKNRTRTKSMDNYAKYSFSDLTKYGQRNRTLDIGRMGSISKGCSAASKEKLIDVNLTKSEARLNKPRKSTTLSQTQPEIKNSFDHVSECKDQNSDETFYAIFDSHGGSPRFVSVTELFSPSFTTEVVSDCGSCEGFQDIDLTIDPTTIDLSFGDEFSQW